MVYMCKEQYWKPQAYLINGIEVSCLHFVEFMDRLYGKWSTGLIDVLRIDGSMLN